MDNLAQVRSILDPMLESADPQLLLEHLADDVRFLVRGPGPEAATSSAGGKTAVLDYFETLGDLLCFWQATYEVRDDEVVARVEESYVLQPADLPVQSELALIFELADGLITGLLVVEDPTPVSPPARSTAGRGW